MATSKIPVFKEEILWEKLDELSSHLARITRIGNTYHVYYFRRAPVANGTVVLSFPVAYAPNAEVISNSWYLQNSGYATIQGVVKPTGVIQLNASTYNEPVAGYFEWVYSK